MLRSSGAFAIEKPVQTGELSILAQLRATGGDAWVEWGQLRTDPPSELLDSQCDELLRQLQMETAFGETPNALTTKQITGIVDLYKSVYRVYDREIMQSECLELLAILDSCFEANRIVKGARGVALAIAINRAASAGPELSGAALASATAEVLNGAERERRMREALA